MFMHRTFSNLGLGGNGSALHFAAATPALCDVLAGVLAEHQVLFERAPDRITPAGREDPVRIVALLRQVLSEGERYAIRVVEDGGRQFPCMRALDDWWKVRETAWFEKALAEDSFTTWFQPIVDTSDGQILAHECLIRLCTERTWYGREILEAARLRGEIGEFDEYARSLSIRSAASQSCHLRYFVNFLPGAVTN